MTDHVDNKGPVPGAGLGEHPGSYMIILISLHASSPLILAPSLIPDELRYVYSLSSSRHQCLPSRISARWQQCLFQTSPPGDHFRSGFTHKGFSLVPASEGSAGPRGRACRTEPAGALMPAWKML